MILETDVMAAVASKKKKTPRAVSRPTRCFVRVAPPLDGTADISVHAGTDDNSIQVPVFHETTDGRRRLNAELTMASYDGVFDGVGSGVDEHVVRSLPF